MRRLLFSTVAVLFTVCLAACGGDSNSGPSGPSTPVVTTQSIAVTMSSPVVVGGTAQASAVATMSNGTTQSVTSGFKSDIASVATVTDSGMVTAVAGGSANIYVVSGGQQGTKNIRVVPSFAGAWSGSYYVTSCSHSGDFASANMCSIFPVSKVFPYNMDLSQSGESVTGTVYMGQVIFSPSSGTIDGGGQVALNGTNVSDTTTIDLVWNLTSPTVGRLNGTMQHTWRDSEASGQMVVTGTIRDSMKTSSAVRTPDAGLDSALRLWQQFRRR
jgi:hypothetical protein